MTTGMLGRLPSREPWGYHQEKIARLSQLEHLVHPQLSRQGMSVGRYSLHRLGVVRTETVAVEVKVIVHVLCPLNSVGVELRILNGCSREVA
jgi:hypothetical protein